MIRWLEKAGGMEEEASRLRKRELLELQNATERPDWRRKVKDVWVSIMVTPTC